MLERFSFLECFFSTRQGEICFYQKHVCQLWHYITLHNFVYCFWEKIHTYKSNEQVFRVFFSLESLFILCVYSEKAKQLVALIKSLPPSSSFMTGVILHDRLCISSIQGQRNTATLEVQVVLLHMLWNQLFLFNF